MECRAGDGIGGIEGSRLSTSSIFRFASSASYLQPPLLPRIPTTSFPANTVPTNINLVRPLFPFPHLSRSSFDPRCKGTNLLLITHFKYSALGKSLFPVGDPMFGSVIQMIEFSNHKETYGGGSFCMPRNRVACYVGTLGSSPVAIDSCRS